MLAGARTTATSGIGLACLAIFVLASTYLFSVRYCDGGRQQPGSLKRVASNITSHDANETSPNSTVTPAAVPERVVECPKQSNHTVAIIQNSTPPERDILLVHVGKTGGSSVRCILERRFMEESCKNKNVVFEPTAVSQRVGAVCHQRPCQYPKFSSIIVTVRNPVERFISWYLYMRAIYRKGGSVPYARKLFNCYNNVIAYAGDLPPPELVLGKKKNSLEYNETACQEVGRKCIMGAVGCPDHNRQGYRFYLLKLFEGDNQTTIYSIRNEYKWQDVERLNLILGGNPKSFAADAMASFSTLRKMHGLRNITLEDRPKVCRYMCNEIDLYKQTLTRSANLHPAQVEKSFAELDESCGGVKTDDLCSL